MAEKDNAFRRMLGDRELFLRFARRYLRREIPDLGPELRDPILPQAPLSAEGKEAVAEALRLAAEALATAPAA